MGLRCCLFYLLLLLLLLSLFVAPSSEQFVLGEQLRGPSWRFGGGSAELQEQDTEDPVHCVRMQKAWGQVREMLVFPSAEGTVFFLETDAGLEADENLRAALRQQRK